MAIFDKIDNRHTLSNGEEKVLICLLCYVFRKVFFDDPR